ncbi:hypothetical protein LCGC14_2898420 [marine sediment metagenome]|uniref:Uncharacterized protein n=1 Tax=marine sediment metagenome TaxID=412755 RepID=A0A0F8XVK8_9ZZZZ
MKKFKQFVKETLEYYLTETHTTEYTYTIKYIKTDEDSRLATISIDGTYLNFEIFIYPYLKRTYDKDPREAKETICHEVCHLLTDPLNDIICRLQEGKFITQEEVESVHERQTQRICNSIFR